MSVKDQLKSIRDLMQVDIGNRGLRTDPKTNLITSTLYDYPAACQSFANLKGGNVAIVTGFVIASVDPPRAETDGPPGALFMARVFHALGMKVTLVTDRYCSLALEAAVSKCGLHGQVRVVELPLETADTYVEDFRSQVGPLTHLISIERAGPSHTPQSIIAQEEGTKLVLERFRQKVAEIDFDRCHNMRGRDITEMTSPTHLLFQERLAEVTIGIGDGGNELGMGKIAWQTVRDNIPNGEVVACRVPTDYLLVCGISNWGGYALARGVALVRGSGVASELFDASRERELLELMVRAGPLVDGVKGEASVSVDGIEFDAYIDPVAEMMRTGQ
jgi:D-glutamate cyclase